MFKKIMIFGILGVVLERAYETYYFKKTFSQTVTDLAEIGENLYD